MTANGRPNLSGLFTGSTPPERSSTIADALDPPRTRARTAPAFTPPSAAPPSVTSPSDAPPPVGSPSATPGAGSAAWWDPVTALGYYFDFLQGLFDANRAVTMAVATAVTAPLRRFRSTR
jgi:hypothetical protein